MARLSAEPEEEGVTTVRRVDREVLVVEVEDELLGFEAELLVEQHRRVTRRHV